jgi:hypothetical protein
VIDEVVEQFQNGKHMHSVPCIILLSQTLHMKSALLVVDDMLNGVRFLRPIPTESVPRILVLVSSVQ